MRGLLIFIIGLFALFALLRAYTDVRSENTDEPENSAANEASLEPDLRPKPTGWFVESYQRPQQYLYFFPLPQGQGSFLPTFGTARFT